MTFLSYDSISEQDTANFALQCAKEAKKDDVFLLNGPLGAGKSVFARALSNILRGKTQTCQARPLPLCRRTVQINLKFGILIYTDLKPLKKYMN